jgi:hypothetical protein
MGLNHARHAVSGLIRSKASFSAIEDRIDQLADLSDQERAALWLYAWSRQGDGWQRAKADQLLEWAGGNI